MRRKARDDTYEPVPTTSNEDERDSKSSPLVGPRCAYMLRIAVLTLTSLVLMDLMYLAFEAVRFGDPCKVALDVKHRLESKPRSIDGKAAPPLPKIIHQQWKNDKVPEGVFTQYRERWKNLFPAPEYEHLLWTDESGRNLIAQHFPWFLETYDGYHMNIQRADAMRYFILYIHGGLYADLDYEPFENFWNALPNDRVSFIESPYKVNEEVQNSLMSSPARDPFWNVTFDVLIERRNSHKVLSSTGPAAMDAAMNTAPSDWSHMLSCENFHRVPLGHAGKNAPLITRVARTFMFYSPLTKTCGNWARRDDCQYGLHHNAVSYMSNMGGNFFTRLKNF